MIGCGTGSSCDEVLNSRWSWIAGMLPVSTLAAGVYLAMLAATFYLGPTIPAAVRRLAWRALLVLVGAAAGSAVWFIFVQKQFIGAFCPYCMTTHTIGLVLAGLVFWRACREIEGKPARDDAVVQPASGDRRGQRRGRVTAIAFVGVGVFAAGILAVCQVVLPSIPVYAAGQAQPNAAPLNPRAVPLVGSPDAAHVVTLLFDYKCPHCQRLHLLLPEVVRRYEGKLAFALCPAPLNTQCNPYIPRDVPAFADSCELARIGLEVWAARRDAFAAFDQWMFSLESGDRWRPRSVDAARAMAVELVGRTKYDDARSDPWVDRYLQTSVRIFGEAGANALPKLVFGSRWVTPQPETADDLIEILQSSLGVPKP